MPKRLTLAVLTFCASTLAFAAPESRVEEELASAHPLLAIQASFAASGFGTLGLRGDGPAVAPGNPLRLQVMLQPVQIFGVLGVGATGEYFFPKSTQIDHAMSLGAQVSYAALFSPSQFLVPVGALSRERVSYRLAGSPPSSLGASGSTLGLWIFLNAFDRTSAKSLMRTYGVSRTYVTLERRTLSGVGADQTISGATYHVGFRIEI